MLTQEPHTQTRIDELRRRGVPQDVVRLGPTVTRVEGFGPPAEVVSWLVDASILPVRVVGPDACDGLADPTAGTAAVAAYEQRLAQYDDELEELADRADSIEARIAAIREINGTGAPVADPAALALAAEWDTLTAQRAELWTSAPEPSAQAIQEDMIVQAHRDVDAARTALDAAKRTERKERLRVYDEACARETTLLREVGAASYTEYLVAASAREPQGTGAQHDERNAALDATELALRARTAQVLGRLPGEDPASELRTFAQDRPVDATDLGNQLGDLERELDEIDRTGEALSGEREAFAANAPVPTGDDPHAALDQVLGSEPVLVVDGTVFDALDPARRNFLCDGLGRAAIERQVVVVRDDEVYDSWLETIPDACLWTVDDARTLAAMPSFTWVDVDGNPTRPDGDAAAGDLVYTVKGTADTGKGRRRKKAAAPEATAEPEAPPVHQCGNHPSVLTKHQCAQCGGWRCEHCIVILDTRRKSRTQCIDCALRDAGLRSGKRR